MGLMPRSENVPPPRAAILAEGPRAAWTLVELARFWPGDDDAPRGDGRPVLVLPGLSNSDRANAVMRRYLRRLGYRAYGWRLGRNRGVRTVGTENERVHDRIAEIYEETGERVTLIGISLGGIMARLAAHRQTHMIREVITISSPFAGPPRATNAWRPFQWLSGEKIDHPAVTARLAEAIEPLPVPATAIWSRSDGLVNGLICHIDEEPTVEVRSSHLFVQMKPRVLRAIAETLAGSEAEARPARASH